MIDATPIIETVDAMNDRSPLPPLIQAIEIWKTNQEVPTLTANYVVSDDVGDLSFGKAYVEQVIETKSPHADAPDEGQSDSLGLLIFPLLISGDVTSVVAIYFSRVAGQVGAVESWVVDRQRRELSLGSGLFLGLGLFEKTSRCIKWPFGAGLPGVTWRTGMPQVVPGLGKSPAFIRGADAADAGLEVGFALPYFAAPDDLRTVLLLLSSVKSPLAHAFGIWTPEARSANVLLSRSVISEQCQKDRGEPVSIDAYEEIATKAWASRSCVLVSLESESSESHAYPTGANSPFSWCLAIPHMLGTKVHAVCTLFGGRAQA